MNRWRPLRTTAGFVLVAALAHPLALAGQLALDLKLGDGEAWLFLDETPKRFAAELLLADWLAAAPVAACLFVLLAVLAWAARRSTGLRLAYRVVLFVLLAAPLLPLVPVLFGLVLAITAVGQRLTLGRAWS